MKTDIQTHKELASIIHESKALLLYFYNDSCAPCVALRPKVEQMVLENFPEMITVYQNASANPLLTADYQVFASPTIIVFFEGKETFRFSKFVSISELAEKIERYFQLMND